MSQKFYKRFFTFKECYQILFDAMRTMKYMSRAKRKEELSTELIEKVMLTVTEINGCEVCTVFHNKVAEKEGIKEEEIQMLFVADVEEIPQEDAPAILFSREYANSSGNPSEDSWNSLKTFYGESKAKGILGAVRTIMMGNALGIVWGALVNRIKGKPVEGSSLWYEISMLVSFIFLIPVALVHALLASLFKKPIIAFQTQEAAV
ncbi:carboxymuconolactone decarboxylase family protein [Mesotoga prima]|uniref:carboxymuconolactone decarboxylase family protein n=1 Tax=Mesotoga prima TaxID=1184387 RepID=UPI002FDB6947